MAKKTVKVTKQIKSNYKGVLVVALITALTVSLYMLKKSFTVPSNINMVVTEPNSDTANKAQKAFTAKFSWPFNLVASFGKPTTWRTPKAYTGKPVWKDGIIVWDNLKPNNQLVLSGLSMRYPEAAAGYQNTFLIQLDAQDQVRVLNPNAPKTALPEAATWQNLDSRPLKVTVSFGRNKRVIDDNKKSEHYGEKINEHVNLGSGTGTITTNQGMQYLMIQVPRKIDAVVEDITVTFDVMNAQEATRRNTTKGQTNLKIDGMFLGKTFLRPDDGKVVKPNDVILQEELLPEPTAQ